jgi:hypothetical protein
MLRKRLVLAASAVVLVLLSVTTLRLYAITYGFVDSTNAYSNVGAFIVQSPASGNLYPICSGTLIAPNVFLTASHCTQYFTDELAAEGYTAFVSFDASIPFGDLTTRKTRLVAVAQAVTNPAYNQSQSDSGDVGVLVLAKSLTDVMPALLPTCGLLDRLVAKNGLKDATFTASGYGLQNRVVGGGVPYFQDVNPIPRMYSFSSFNSLNGGYIRLSQNAATGNGGTCFGDSGGPNFLTVNGKQLLVADTVTGDAVCQSTNVDYRLDTPAAQAFFAYVNATYGTAIPVSTCAQ